MDGPVSPAPVKGSGRKELPAYAANGIIGLRSLLMARHLARQAARRGGVAGDQLDAGATAAGARAGTSVEPVSAKWVQHDCAAGWSPQ